MSLRAPTTKVTSVMNPTTRVWTGPETRTTRTWTLMRVGSSSKARTTRMSVIGDVMAPWRLTDVAMWRALNEVCEWGRKIIMPPSIIVIRNHNAMADEWISQRDKIKMSNWVNIALCWLSLVAKSGFRGMMSQHCKPTEPCKHLCNNVSFFSSTVIAVFGHCCSAGLCSELSCW